MGLRSKSTRSETYSELLQQGYEIISTGGGFTAWAKDFSDYCVTVTGDGFVTLSAGSKTQTKSKWMNCFPGI